MGCERWQDAISARLDGEDAGVDEALLDAHLRRCGDCRRFAELATSMRPRLRVGIADEMPDLSPRVRKLAAIADRAASWSIVRGLLAVVAIQIVVFSVPALFGNEPDSSTHAARHLGAFTAAYGIGLLVIVVRPARARALLPLAAVLAVALAITAIVDLLDGRVPLLGEAAHIPELLSVLLVWALAVPRPPSRRGARRATVPLPPLRIVDERRDTA